MGSVVSRGKAPKMPSSAGMMPQAMPQYQPPEIPEDKTAIEAEKSRIQKAVLLQKGRQSTILTDENLGGVTLGKHTLLGGAA